MIAADERWRGPGYRPVRAGRCGGHGSRGGGPRNSGDARTRPRPRYLGEPRRRPTASTPDANSPPVEEFVPGIKVETLLHHRHDLLAGVRARRQLRRPDGEERRHVEDPGRPGCAERCRQHHPRLRGDHRRLEARQGVHGPHRHRGDRGTSPRLQPRMPWMSMCPVQGLGSVAPGLGPVRGAVQPGHGAW